MTTLRTHTPPPHPAADRPGADSLSPPTPLPAAVTALRGPTPPPGPDRVAHGVELALVRGAPEERPAPPAPARGRAAALRAHLTSRAAQSTGLAFAGGVALGVSTPVMAVTTQNVS